MKAATAAILKILNLKCREAAELLSAAQEEPLGWGDRWAVRLHLLICGHCRRYLRHLTKVRRIARDALKRLEEGGQLPGVHLSAEARQRLRGRVESAGD
jgi:hypothetical protein